MDMINLISVIGAGIVLLAFVLQKKISLVPYYILNASGSFILVGVGLYYNIIGIIILNGMWTLNSIANLVYELLREDDG